MANILEDKVRGGGSGGGSGHAIAGTPAPSNPTANYEINYNDSRFKQVESDENAALTEMEQAYGGMIDEAGKYYQEQIDASKQWADKQSSLQQEQTDFAIEQIQQQKDQAQKDYTKEQSGAYADWRKQSNQYGVGAEQMASAGLENTGFSESSQVGMYNTYQSRVAVARESFQRAVVSYDNAMTEARLQNNAVLAEIAYNTFQKQLELALQGFQYENQLILDQTSKKLELDQMYYGRWQDVLNQINAENAIAEEIRQYNERMAEEKRQYDRNYQLQLQQIEEDKRQWEAEMAFEREQFEYQKAKNSGGGGGSGGNYMPVDDDTPEVKPALPNTNPSSTPAPKKSTGKFNEVNLSDDSSFVAKDYIAQQYNIYKNSGTSTALTDELLNAAVEEGIITRREATELRNGR